MNCSRLGHETRVTGPDKTRRLSFALPFYPEITLEFFAGRRLAKVFREYRPDFIHCDRGAVGVGSATFVSISDVALCDSIPYALSRIIGSARAARFVQLRSDGRLCGLAPLSCASQRGHGGDGVN